MGNVLTKEEILDNGKLVDTNVGQLEMYIKEHCLNAMDEFAKQSSIGFAEWMLSCNTEMSLGIIVNAYGTYDSVEELYQIYLKESTNRNG